jgi:hypothetical protein
MSNQGLESKEEGSYDPWRLGGSVEVGSVKTKNIPFRLNGVEVQIQDRLPVSSNSHFEFLAFGLS